MSSRKFLLYLDGLLIDPQSNNGWYARQVRMDWEDEKAEKAAVKERLHRAEMKAQIQGKPLEMADLQR